MASKAFCCRKYYIDGRWRDPVAPSGTHLAKSPVTELAMGEIVFGGETDVNLAVESARKALPAWSGTTVAERQAVLRQIAGRYRARYDEIAEAVTREMGAPIGLSRTAQAGSGLGHIETMIAVLDDFAFEECVGAAMVLLEPIGVCALIAPWNWPINQLAAKVVPALAAGCTMVFKPSEYSSLSAVIWAEILDEAGLPPGVFNLVFGDGPGVGAALARHPGVDMVSFTGSTAAGIEVARNAAPTIKRVTQELGGKSPFLLLEDADFEAAIPATLGALFDNAGQTCTAPSRMLVPRTRLVEAETIARRVAEALVPGDPADPGTTLGPLVSERQFSRVQGFIEGAIADGASLVTGGPGRPAGIDRGYFAQPTIFSDVAPDMTIAREEIFGPVLSIIPYDDLEEAIGIANDTPYGLAAYVWSADAAAAMRVGRRIRAGLVRVNGAAPTLVEPFGGFKQSGNGREWGSYGLREYLEVKSLLVERSF